MQIHQRRDTTKDLPFVRIQALNFPFVRIQALNFPFVRLQALNFMEGAPSTVRKSICLNTKSPSSTNFSKYLGSPQRAQPRIFKNLGHPQKAQPRHFKNLGPTQDTSQGIFETCAPTKFVLLLVQVFFEKRQTGHMQSDISCKVNVVRLVCRVVGCFNSCKPGFNSKDPVPLLALPCTFCRTLCRAQWWSPTFCRKQRK